MVCIKLKWNKATIECEVQNDQSEGAVSLFKKRVFELTGVPEERQKLMAKGVWTGRFKKIINLK
jgi:hypothetical protein